MLSVLFVACQVIFAPDMEDSLSNISIEEKIRAKLAEPTNLPVTGTTRAGWTPRATFRANGKAQKSAPAQAPTRITACEDDDEDFWDNVPI